MKNKYNRILFIVSVLLITLGLLFNVLHYKIGFITGYKLMLLGIILNINVFFFMNYKSNQNK